MLWILSTFAALKLLGPVYGMFLEWIDTKHMTMLPAMLIVLALVPICSVVGSFVAFTAIQKIVSLPILQSRG